MRNKGLFLVLAAVAFHSTARAQLTGSDCPASRVAPDCVNWPVYGALTCGERWALYYRLETQRRMAELQINRVRLEYDLRQIDQRFESPAPLREGDWRFHPFRNGEP
jgi:hypothetical protein